MIEQTVRIWRCEHCRKHRHSRWPADHEAHCYANPARVPWEGELVHAADETDQQWRPAGEAVAGDVFLYHEGRWVSLGKHGADWPEWQSATYQDNEYGPHPFGDGGLCQPALSLKMCPAKDRWEAAVECGYVDEETPARAEVASR